MSKNVSYTLKRIILSILIAMIVFSCKKDDENEEIPTIVYVPFSVEFSDDGGHDFGWVVLHDQNNTSLIDYKKYTGNQLVDFGEVPGERITVTIINIDTSHFAAGIYWDIVIRTEIGVPAGKWKVKGYSYQSRVLGTADITIHYPEGEYNKILTVIPHYANMSGWLQPSGYNYSTNIYGSSGDDLFYIYCAVFSDNGGYCNWLFDDDVELYQVNFYEMTLSEIITRRLINFNTMVDNVSLNGYWIDRNLPIRLYYDWDLVNSYHAELFLPEEMPLSELSLYTSYSHDWYYMSYSKFYDSATDIPEYLSIPEHSISGNYDEAQDIINNIQITGNADFIAGYWYSRDDKSDGVDISWQIRASSDKNSISKPILPQEIQDEIGSFLDHLSINSLYLTDYNTAIGLDDFIYMDYINNVSYPFRYDESYSFSYKLGNSQELKEMNRESSQSNIQDDFLHSSK